MNLTQTVESPTKNRDGFREDRKWLAPAVSFCVLTFALSWSLWLASMIAYERLILNINIFYLHISDPIRDALTIAGSIAPGFAALIVGVFTRWKYFPNPLGRIRPRSPVGILYPLAILAPILIAFTFFALQYDLNSNSFANLHLIDLVRLFSVNLLLTPLWEECGWRGCLLPIISARFGLGKASLIVGLIWALWHIPLYFGIYGSSFQWYVIWFIGIVGMSVVLSVFYASSGNCILLTILFHDIWNATTTWLYGTNPKLGLVQLAFTSGAFWTLAGLMWLWKRPSLDEQMRSVV